MPRKTSEKKKRSLNDKVKEIESAKVETFFFSDYATEKFLRTNMVKVENVRPKEVIEEALNDESLYTYLPVLVPPPPQPFGGKNVKNRYFDF